MTHFFVVFDSCVGMCSHFFAQRACQSVSPRICCPKSTWATFPLVVCHFCLTLWEQPRVQFSSNRPRPYLQKPAQKRRKKFKQATALAQHFELGIQKYADKGWAMIYLNGSMETHPDSGQVWWCGVFFVDHRDTTESMSPPTNPKT